MNTNSVPPAPQQSPQQTMKIRPETPFAVPAMLINMLLQYLHTQPYGEVRDMVGALERCAPVPDAAGPSSEGNSHA